MARFTLVGVATILSSALATPLGAQAVIQQPGSYAFYHPSVDSRIEPAPTQPREGPGTGNARALAPSFRPSVAGAETTTRPWSPPLGHRQPRAADVPTSTTSVDLD